jgi:hypothetical protein
MRLFEHDLLELWTGGEAQHPLDRAIGALAMASGDRRATVADLAIGERDVRLFELYRALAGPWIRATARCPACGEVSELSMAVDDLSPWRDEARASEVTVNHGGVVVRCRQPSSRDLAAASQAASDEEARAILIAASVIDAHRGDAPLGAEQLDPAVIAHIEERLSEMDPPAETLLGLTCPGCEQAWSAPFDIGDAFCASVELAARRAMDTVAELARAYGWSEDVVLALPPARRRYYLERA